MSNVEVHEIGLGDHVISVDLQEDLLGLSKLRERAEQLKSMTKASAVVIVLPGSFLVV